MHKRYDPNEKEPEIYKLWEKSGYFNPDNLPSKTLASTHQTSGNPLKSDDSPRKPYTIILPPPNASGKMHTGNVLMIAIEDLLIRWKRMQGYAALWIPGTDHAGFETQITFEKKLKKEGKSRFDFDRKTLYKKIWDFVHENKSEIEIQIKSMGASIDWSRYRFTLDDEIVNTVHQTFAKMHDDGLIYRDDYMVNYCPKCGTTFADLEVKYIERKDPLYYIKYGPFTLATVRPETKFGDTAIAVNPKDKRYQKYIGKEIVVEGLLGKVTLKVIADDYVDPDFGTGVVKVTPAHDKKDYEAGKRHNLEIKRVIELNGKLNDLAGKYAGLSVFSARKQVVEDLEKKGLIEKIKTDYIHTVATCYKGRHDIEPMIVPNWFVKVDMKGKSFKKPALDAVTSGKVTIYPSWRKKTYTRWMDEMHDWPISRQIVWGIRIPVWYDTNKNPNIMVTFLPISPEHLNEKTKTITGKISDLLKKYSLSEIESGLQNLFAPAGSSYIISEDKPKSGNFIPETDTFDTWFSSGQWPLVTLSYPDSKDFKKYYPTDVLETGWEIIRLWVSRMIMFGIYLTKKPPFHTVYLHGIVRATNGKKMSKSLGNVINPDEYQKLYGTDALRMGLISGTANGKDFNFPKDKVIAYRNFSNKLWNIARFLDINRKNVAAASYTAENKTRWDRATTNEDKRIIKKLNKLIKQVNSNLERYRFAQAAEDIYHFVWDDFASDYIEKSKEKLNDESIEKSQKIQILNTSYHILTTNLKLLHPFMPFVTEAIWKDLPKKVKEENNLLMITEWPSERIKK